MGRTKAVLARIVAEGEKLFGMCYREWKVYAMEIKRKKMAREERVKALMGRLALQSQGMLVMCIREWIGMWEEAFRRKQAEKGGKEEKKRAAIAKFAANGERFQAMVLQGWHTFAKEKRLKEEKKQQRVHDLLKRISMESEGLLMFIIRAWIDDTHECLRAKGKQKEGKEEKKRAAIAKFAANGERFQ